MISTKKIETFRLLFFNQYVIYARYSGIENARIC